jgi:hypothetical protein
MPLSDEVHHVQNPALGATLIWRFVVGHWQANSNSRACPFHLAFLVLPITLHSDTYRLLAATQRGSGLRKFSEKFALSQNKQSDLLFAIHDRARRLRPLSLESLQVAARTSLVEVLYEEGSILPLSTTPPKVGIAKSTQDLLRNSEKLGAWCAELTMHEVSAILKVRF